MAVGFWQILLILLIVLILFGRGKLPALAEDLGKSVRLFKKGMNGEENEKTPSAVQRQTGNQIEQHQR